MSYPFREISIAEATNSNALHPQGFQPTRKTKREDTSSRSFESNNGPQACKRAALGTITNVSRVQPSRAAKQAFPKSTSFSGAFGAENVPPSGFAFHQPSTGPAFSIHVDSIESRLGPSVSAVSREDESSLLGPSVTGLPRQPLVCLDTIDLTEPSPMHLDTSLTDDRLHQEPPKEEKSEDSIYDVAVYAKEVFEYLREAERRNRPKPGYMKKQPDITSSMRCILIDWLVEVSEEYKLTNETLYLSVSYIDRFLSQMSVLRAKLQLVGTASAFIASKFEEIYPPELKEFVYITDDTYTAKQVLRMEHMILKVLSFDLAVPTINVFLPPYIKASQGDSKLENLTMYLAELSLQHYEFVQYLPSTIAASAVCLARHTLHQHAWTSHLCQETGYLFEDISPCVSELYSVFKEAPSFPQQAVRDKYKSQKYSSISLTTARDEAPSYCL